MIEHDELARLQRTFSEGHDYIWASLPFLVPMAAKLSKECCGPGSAACACLGEIVAELRGLLLDHLAREERTLEAISWNPDAGFIRACVAEMHAEHVMVQELLERVRAAAGLGREPRDGACPTERALLRALAALDQHVREQIWIEDEVLGPRLASDGQDW